MYGGLFTVHKFEIPFENFNEPIYLIPIGDVHRFAHNCAERQYLSLLEWIEKRISEGSRMYVIGMGDEDDLASAHERFALEHAGLHSTTIKTLDDLAKKHAYDFAKEWEFLKGRIIGCFEGNHHYKFASGVTSTQLICEHLNCRYLGFASYIRITLKHTKSGRGYSVDILGTHGRGGARTVGGSINAVDKLDQIAEADIYLMAHDHRKWVVNKSKLKISTHGTVKHRKILLARTGSFQLGYMQDQENYASSGLMSPNDIGVIKIELTPQYSKSMQSDGKRHEEAHVDIHASI